MNICVLSNSHAASLKSGWDRLNEQFPNIDLTFFATPNRGMLKVKLDANKAIYSAKCPKITEMLSVTSDGYDHINVEDYDAFLVYGLFLDVPRLDIRLSSAVKEAALNDTVAGSINYRFVKELSEHSLVPVFYSPTPMPSNIDNRDVNEGPIYCPYLEVARALEGRFVNLRARIVTQPEDTLDDENMTKREFSIGSTRLKSGNGESHSSTDTRHMNDHYGAKYLRKAIPIIRCHASINEYA